MWARQWNGSGSGYSSSDSKYVTRTLSEFHPRKLGNWLCWNGVQKLQCWQKRRLPFFSLCSSVGHILRMKSTIKWVPVERWNHKQRLQQCCGPGTVGGRPTTCCLKPGRNLQWLLVLQQRDFVRWECEAQQSLVGDRSYMSFCGWPFWLWNFMATWLLVHDVSCIEGMSGRIMGLFLAPQLVQTLTSDL